MLQAEFEIAIDHRTESSSVDYKSSFDANSPGDWVEIVKDLIAFANSGGGVVIFGLTDDGTASAYDCNALESLDPAMVTDKIYKYTGLQFHAFTFLRATRDGRGLFAIAIEGGNVPIVFSKPGTYDVGGGKQKTAFSVGTMYFSYEDFPGPAEL
jgi:predicted HTH transcriptional regulator